MRYRRNLISFVILTMFVGLGSLALGSARTWAQDCIITIEKVAIPADNTPFNFFVTGDVTGDFTLMDPDFTIEGFAIDVGQTVTLTEEVIPGWAVDNIECTEGVTNCGATPCLTATVDGNSVTFECLDNDRASCTITNVAVPSNVPTLSEWGLIAMAGILGITGLLVIRRRRAAA